MIIAASTTPAPAATKPSALRWVMALMMALMVSGCAANNDRAAPGFFEKIFKKETYQLYRIDIQQGNVIDPQKLAQLKVGMSKKQVRYLLGNPVSHHVFHKNRWDYRYYLIPGKGELEKYRLSLVFDKDRLTDIRKSKELMKRLHELRQSAAGG